MSTKGVLSVIGGFLAFVLITFSVAGYFGIQAYNRAQVAILASVDPKVAKITRHWDPSDFASVASAFALKSQTEEDRIKWSNLVRPKFGKTLSISPGRLIRINRKQIDGEMRTIANIEYTGTFETGSAKIRVMASKSGNDWQIDDFTINPQTAK